jgi:predicted permease
MGLSLPERQYKDSAKASTFFNTLLSRVRLLPGVQSVGAISTLPGAGYGGDTLFTIPELPSPPHGDFQFAIFRGVDTDYFKTLEIPLLEGRVFDPRDAAHKHHRVVISSAFARKFFPHDDPLGKHLRVNWDDGRNNFEIIGVVGDTRYFIARPIKPMMYFPIDNGFTEASLLTRTAQEPLSLGLPVRRIVAQVDPSLGVANILTLEQMIGTSLSSQSFEAAVITGFAALSLLLASIGLYGTLSYVVAQRTSEIGIRIALGAQRGELIRKTLLQGIKPAVSGLLVGTAGSIAVTRLMQSILFETSPLDAWVLSVVPLVIFLVAVGACAIPAIRASGIDAMAALRIE